MSADNMICIQLRKDGRWWVWMDFASCEITEPNESAESFAERRDATLYASGWYRGETIVEYGIRILDAEENKTNMNIKEVEGWINAIKELDASGDYEKAHASEDALLLEFVTLIAAQDNEYSESQVIAEKILEFMSNNDSLRYAA